MHTFEHQQIENWNQTFLWIPHRTNASTNRK